MTEPVQILLATYQGERYLPDLLESLLRLEPGTPWHLLWRDDTSADATPALLAAFAERHGRASRLPEEGARRLGATGSFMALLRGAPEDAPGYAFCDQDDVWLPHKLARALERLRALPADRPALYCGRQKLVDATLGDLGLSPRPLRPLGLRNALVQNVVTGCTAVLNPAARRLMLAAPPPPQGALHDWWCYLVVSAAGGTVIFDEEPGLLYRQHGGNMVGSQGSLAARARAAARRGPARFMNLMAAHIAALEGAPQTPEARRVLGLLREMPAQSAPARLWRLWRAGLYRQGVVENLALWAWVLACRPAVPGQERD
ncbi:glycosyltransferase [Roseomonas sp. GC11]|uniref:glycosyltransferase n=1 Tax=Roseomonas sp. GC11 TaxID=2950546 RepID=UPI00210AAEED|nr:glycosyltransferase [Roseomonas sp. GC11]MCQ4159633.1 glycosyltransferase [Roseomonas sp. GC11]